MKWILLLLVCAAVAWFFFVRQPAKIAVVEPVPAPVASPTPRQRNLAPDGVYFLLARVGITEDSGITGIVPGTKITLIRQTGTRMTVSDGKHQFEVEASQVTNDLDIAAQVTRADRATQS